MVVVVDWGDVRSRTSYNDSLIALKTRCDWGDVRSRTSYNFDVAGEFRLIGNWGDVRSRTSYNFIKSPCLPLASNWGDVRSRTSYNSLLVNEIMGSGIEVTSDLGRVTTKASFQTVFIFYWGDVRSRTSYNELIANRYNTLNWGDVRSRTSYNITRLMAHHSNQIEVTSDLGRVTT